MTQRHAEQAGRDDVFNRPLHLAGVLDNAADELESTWFGYEWNDRSRCNCGVVARQVMRTTAADLRKLLPPIYERGVFRPTWTAMTKSYCPDSGLPQNEVFAHLIKAGLRSNDFFHLEELSHPRIVARMEPLRRSRQTVRRSRKSDVIAYLRSWATGIEEYRDRRTSPSTAEVETTA